MLLKGVCIVCCGSLVYCQRSGSWPTRALDKNMLTFWMICMSQAMDKYPELLYEEWKGKKLCWITWIRLGQITADMCEYNHVHGTYAYQFISIF